MAARRGPKDWEPTLKPSDVDGFQSAKSLVIRAPKWFERADFQEWRLRSGVATWNFDPPNQDVFIVYADDELDWLTEGMPKDIFRKIMRLVEAQDMHYGVVWIKAV